MTQNSDIDQAAAQARHSQSVRTAIICRNRVRTTILTRIAVAFFVASLVFPAEQREYNKGTLDRWDLLSTGTDCSTREGLLSGISTHCAKTGVRVYHVLTSEGFDYTLQPETWDPFKAVQLGQEISYRIDEKGNFWTPDPKHGVCPWPCTGEKRREFKSSGDPKHEAKYFVNLVEKRKVDPYPALTNKDVLDMSRLGLSEALIFQKINTSKTAFDLSIPALKALKDSGVSDTLISAMMQRQNQ